MKLLDFGLTCSTEAITAETAVRLTMPGTVMGTPQYIAPEQLKGERIDSRADLFAAGVVLYEMLAGRPPFMGRSPVEVFHGVVYEQPPVLTGGPAIAALDRVVHRALAKRPDDRYPTAETMAQEVRGALAPPIRNSSPDSRTPASTAAPGRLDCSTASWMAASSACPR